MEIRQLRAFQAVATQLNFSRAAERLNYAQSSISAQIQTLEDDLGVRLFDRMGRRVLLTEAGERLLKYADKILALADETRAEVAETNEPQGSLTIRIPETFGKHWLPSVLKRFCNRFPKVRLSFTTCAHDGLAGDLRKGITDLAFLFTDAVQAADLDMEIIGYQKIHIVSGPGHRLASKRKVRAEDLNGEALLLSKVDCSYRKNFQELLSEKHVHPGAVLEFNSVAVIRQCVMSGSGITVLPEIEIAGDKDGKRLVVLPWEDDPLEVAVFMIWYKDRWMSPTLKAFMEITKESLP